MGEFRMPSLGAGMDEGTLLEWLVAPGDSVHRGDIVATVDTAKAAVEVECFENGVIEQLIVQPGTRVPVGTVLATIAADGRAEPPPGVEPIVEPAAGRGAETVVSPPRRPPLASPPVRHFAQAHGVNLSDVHGTGRAGRITQEDVRRVAAKSPAGPAKPSAAPAKPSAAPAKLSAEPEGPAPGRRVRSSPMARRLAAELGVDLAQVSGTGGHGVIRAEDVRRAGQQLEAPTVTGAPTVTAAPPVTAASGAERVAQLRRATARLMARSKREIPHYYLSSTVDMTAALDWLRGLNQELSVGERIVPAALLNKAAARAAHDVSALNGYWRDDHFDAASVVRIGIATALRGGGLVVPAIDHADELTIPDLMKQMRDLVSRTRAGRLRASDLTEPTITVSNLGDLGADTVFGVIYPPQVALVGFGAVVERPVVVAGAVEARPVVMVSLSADHRASDGATGSRFLRAVGQLLQDPEEL